MARGLCIIYLFILLICKASLQVTVVGFTGDSIVLPCSSSNNDLKREEITVYWRHNSSRNVYNIINGKDSIEGQNTAYKNRVETFPEEYVKGNFSLKLNNLQYTDGGKYICYITKALQNPTVELLIKGKQAGDKRNHAAETRPERIVSFFISFFSVYFLLCV